MSLSGEFNLRTLEQARKENAVMLINGAYDGFSSLAADFIASAKKQPDEISIQQASEALENADSTILTFLESGPYDITILPRTQREDDKVRLIPGQHAGVSLQYYNIATGLIARANFYGGLRDPKHHLDMHDTDTTLKLLHSKRTEQVVSQPIYLNLHMLGPAEINPFLDIWLVITMRNIQLETFKFEEYYQAQRTLPNTDKRFKPIFSQLNTAMKNLMLMVPNPYSPR